MDILLSYTFWIGARGAFLLGACTGAKIARPARVG